MQVKPQSLDNDVVVIAYDIVSPIGIGKQNFLNALYSGASAIRCGLFPDLESEYEHGIPTAPIDDDLLQGFARDDKLDRTLQFIDICLENLSTELEHVYSNSKPFERGVFAATSKGGILSGLNHDFRNPKYFSQLFCHDIGSHLISRTDSLGPAQSFVGACATSLQNLIQATNCIKDGMCDVGIVASSEASLHPLYLSSFINLKAYAQTSCFPFDERHEGFVAGEGAAVIILASRKWAERHQFEPVAKISGTSSRSDAYHSVAIDSTGESIAACGNEAIKRSNLSPNDINFVQTHGTATKGNDEAESNAIQLIWDKDRKPWIHGIKGSTGHLMGAAGMIETVASLEILRNQAIPPTAGFRTYFEENQAMHLATQTQKATIDHILKWSFGFGGHLAAVVLSREQF